MIRISVVSTRDVFRKSTKIIILVILFVFIIYISKYSKIHFNKVEIDTKTAISFLSEEITAMGDLSYFDISKINPESIIEKEFSYPNAISKLEGEEIVEKDDVEEQLNSSIDEQNLSENLATQDTIETVSEGQPTEVIKSSYKQTYNFEVEGVRVKNESKYDLNTLNLSSSNSKVENKNVIIFHTHTCESYTQTDKNRYVESGNFRTTDLSKSVVRVGDVLQSYLSGYGFKVVHDKTIHDYPAYNGSYGRSLKTVNALKQKNPKTDIIIDLHRDAMSDETYAPKVKIGDEYVAQIMFVIGTDGSGLTHDNWRKNLEFAIKVQKIGNEMYPGLFKPIIVRNARYNQHLSNAATIIEFGATGNTLEECEAAAKYLAKVLDKSI